jgi:hypothetical protein
VTEVQVVFWRDIPAQVKARQAGQRAARVLTPRFQEAIDMAAMRAGLTETDAYLEQWRSSAWEVRPGSPEAVVEQWVAELEAEYSDERLRALAENGGKDL